MPSAADKRLTWANWPLCSDTDDPGIRFVVRRAGAELWSESLVVMIPGLARHKAHAERLVDRYCEPGVAAELAAWVTCVCLVPAAQDVLASAADEETAALAEDPLIFPDAAVRARLAVARDITPGERVEFAKRWNAIAGCSARVERSRAVGR